MPRKKELSRQVRWQNKARAEGLCPQCRGKPEESYVMCVECLSKLKARRERQKASGWKRKPRPKPPQKIMV